MSLEAEVGRLREGHRMLQETMQVLAVQQAVTAQSIAATTGNVDRLSGTVDKMGAVFELRFAPRSKFELIERIVMTACGVCLLTVFGAILTYVIQHPRPFG